MDTKLIIIQLVVVAQGVYLAFTENKRNIYLFTFLFNLASLVMYAFNRDLTASVSCAVLTVRAFIYIYKDRLRASLSRVNASLIPIFFILLHAVMGAVTMDRPIQILSVLAPMLTTAYMWWGKNTQDLRMGNFLAYTLWAVYELITGLYIVMVSDMINALTFLTFFIYYMVQKRKGSLDNHETGQ